MPSLSNGLVVKFLIIIVIAKIQCQHSLNNLTDHTGIVEHSANSFQRENESLVTSSQNTRVYTQNRSETRNELGTTTMWTLENNRERSLPLAIIIASPVAAVSILLFLCVAYCCHSAQLNQEQKKRRKPLTPQISLELDEKQDTWSPTTSTRSQRSRSSSPFAMLAQEIDVYSPRRKSMMALHALTVPANLHSKRGSGWGASIDQELMSLSAPKRHSSFIL